jgi:hypothetical protein
VPAKPDSGDGSAAAGRTNNVDPSKIKRQIYALICAFGAATSPGDTHQVTSLPAAVNMVPPTESTKGLHEGKSTCAFPSSIWSPEPSSPDEMQAVTPTKRNDELRMMHQTAPEMHWAPAIRFGESFGLPPLALDVERGR